MGRKTCHLCNNGDIAKLTANQKMTPRTSIQMAEVRWKCGCMISPSDATSIIGYLRLRSCRQRAAEHLHLTASITNVLWYRKGYWFSKYDYSVSRRLHLLWILVRYWSYKLNYICIHVVQTCRCLIVCHSRDVFTINMKSPFVLYYIQLTT